MPFYPSNCCEVLLVLSRTSALRFPHTPKSVWDTTHSRIFLCVLHLNFRKSLTEIPRNGCGTMQAAAVTCRTQSPPTGGWPSWRVLARPRPVCKNIWGEIGDCHVTTPSRRRRRVVPHTHFWMCGTVQLESFESLQRRCSGAMHRREPAAALPLCTREVAPSEPDVLVTHLAIERAGDYDLIGRPLVHDGLVLQAPRHGHVECVSRVLLHGSRPERRAVSQGWAVFFG